MNARLCSLVSCWGILIRAGAGSAWAADISWLGSSGDWNTPSNWSSGVVPGPGDSATINGGAVTADTDISVESLVFTGGTLQGAGAIHVTGLLAWSGGTMSGTGKTILEKGATGNWSGAADKWLNRPMDNLGTVQWDQGRFVLQDKSFSNQGTMTISHDADIVSAGGNSVFENLGTLHKTSPGTVNFNSVVFNQGGTLDFAAGTLVLGGGGENRATIQVPAGGQLRLTQGYSQPAGSTLTGAGDVRFESGSQTVQGQYTISGMTVISGATVNFEREVTLGQLQFSNGTLQGAGAIHVTGLLAWNGGTMSGTGKTILEKGATGNWSGAADKWLNRSMDNLGTVQWDQGRFVLQDRSFSNQGTMTISHDADIVSAGGNSVFENLGTLHKTSPGTVNFNSVVFNQGGTLDFAAGTLALGGGGENRATIQVPAGGQLRLTQGYSQPAGSTLIGAGDVRFESGSQTVQGQYTISGMTVISGATVNFEREVTLGQLQFSNGTLQGAGAIHVTGLLAWNGGTMSGTGKTILEKGATGNWNGAADKWLNRSMDNLGTVQWDQGRFVLQDKAFSNQGTMTISHDADIVSAGGNSVFENLGTLHKTSPGTVNFNSVVFNQGGTLDFAAGTLALGGGGENRATIQVPAGGQLRLTQSYSQPAGSTLTGAGDVRFESGSQAVQGQYTISGMTVISGATVNFERDVTLGQLQFSNGTLQGAGAIHVTGLLAWSGGTMSGTGKTILEKGATGNWSGAADKWLNRPMDNLGTVQWDQGRFVLQDKSFSNQGTMTISHDADIVSAGGNSVFENLGTLHKTSPGTVNFNSVVFNQGGTLDFGAGTLVLGGGGENRATIQVPAGGQLRLTQSYSQPAGSTLTGAGDVRFESGSQTVQGQYTISGMTVISGATVNFEREVTLGQLQFSNGILQGAGAIHVTGLLAWNGGTMSGTGKTILEKGATGNWSGAADKWLNRSMDNLGTVQWDQGRFVLQDKSFSNQGTMTISHDADIVSAGGNSVFENLGTLYKPSTGTLNFNGVTFNQRGAFQAIGTINVRPGAFVQDGRLDPGFPTGVVLIHGTGVVLINGDLPQGTNALIHIDIAGRNPGSEYDQLNVTGLATLQGTLKLLLLNGFHPAAGDTFSIMTFGSRLGSFDTILGVNLENQLFLEPLLTATNLVLKVVDSRSGPQLTATARGPGAAPKFSVSNVAGQDVTIEATFDIIKPQWEPVLTNSNSGIIFQFIDSDWHNHPMRFFRAFLPP